MSNDIKKQLETAQATLAEANEKLAKAQAAVETAKDLPQAVARVRAAKAEVEDAGAVVAVVQRRYDAALAKQREREKQETAKQEQAATVEAEKVAADVLAKLLALGPQVVGLYAQAFAATEAKAKLSALVQQDGGAVSRFQRDGAADAIISTAAYSTTPHVPSNLEPAASLAALLRWTADTGRRQAEEQEQRRRVLALEEARQLAEDAISPDPEVRASAEKKAKERTARFYRPAGADPFDMGAQMARTGVNAELEKARATAALNEKDEE